MWRGLRRGIRPIQVGLTSLMPATTTVSRLNFTVYSSAIRCNTPALIFETRSVKARTGSAQQADPRRCLCQRSTCQKGRVMTYDCAVSQRPLLLLKLFYAADRQVIASREDLTLCNAYHLSKRCLVVNKNLTNHNQEISQCTQLIETAQLDD